MVCIFFELISTQNRLGVINAPFGTKSGGKNHNFVISIVATAGRVKGHSEKVSSWSNFKY